ncbi:hypothetical protein [Paraliomyxa miuraensis]|uniref:hypothetical protein n=1 Tax=Paraliomyxa miuraensis TaxID=376150 RepID=UPI002252572F|nr:hypothetical protein [Paraliomyxa miuraensis]MCX4241711.1 hypothetical protein [Paraliomyxa miuraensis]
MSSHVSLLPQSLGSAHWGCIPLLLLPLLPLVGSTPMVVPSVVSSVVDDEPVVMPLLAVVSTAPCVVSISEPMVVSLEVVGMGEVVELGPELLETSSPEPELTVCGGVEHALEASARAIGSTYLRMDMAAYCCHMQKLP